jgi:hypothetical protein
MDIETALATYLLAQTGITGKVALRIYPLQAPQAVAKPYLVYFRVDSNEVSSHGGPSGLAASRFQFSSFALTYGGAKALAAAVKAALDGFSGIMGGVGGIQVDIPSRVNEMDGYDSSLAIYYVDSDYILWHEEV